METNKRKDIKATTTLPRAGSRALSPQKSSKEPQTAGQNSWFEQIDKPRCDDSTRCYRVLVADLVGLEFDAQGLPDCAEFAAHVSARGGSFWSAADASNAATSAPPEALLNRPGILFEYRPELKSEQELVALTADGRFDAIIAAATVIPSDARFAEGGVRIGAGTANMASESFVSGAAPLMNTPGFNSRATAQMVFKALLRVRPNLPLEQLHTRVVEGCFDTGDHLPEFPTHKLEGQRFAVLGYGNIGREVALIARAFGMKVAVYARSKLKPWIEAEGFEYCATPVEAATGANVLSPHLGLGPLTGRESEPGFANAGIVNAAVLNVLAPDAVLINFDRGELVNTADLHLALDNQQVSQIAIDADIFCSGSESVGPLAPYLKLLRDHEPRVLLLPHAAADTDHPSRVAGALQAADQIIAAIRYRCVVNGVGSVPEGYTELSGHSVPGVGKVSAEAIQGLSKDAAEVSQLRAQLSNVDRWLEQLQTNSSGGAEGVDTQDAVLALNRLANRARELGLLGPGTEL